MLRKARAFWARSSFEIATRGRYARVNGETREVSCNTEGAGRSFTVEAELHFLAPEHGGKAVAMYSGYRPQLHCLNRDWNVVILFTAVDSVRGGDVVRATVSFEDSGTHPGQIEMGSPFILHEARRTVAYGRVLGILEAR